MRYVKLPHFPNPINVDTIVRVSWSPAAWRGLDPGKPHAAREYIWWGKPVRVYPHWYSYHPATVTLHLVGDDFLYRECRPNEAERFADDIKQALAALTESGPERIVAAAVRRLDANRAWTPLDGVHTYNWMTYTQPAPARHHHILHSMPSDPGTDHVLSVQQGFLTSTGRFVDRKEAMGLAIAAGQVNPANVRLPSLFSEDLW